MSLKAFHIIFIAASILLSFGFAAWALVGFVREGNWGYLVMGVVALIVGVALIFYGKYVLKKLKKISYL